MTEQQKGSAPAPSVVVDQKEQQQQPEQKQKSADDDGLSLDEKVARAENAGSELDRKWEEFQNLFKQMNEKMAAAMGGVAAAYRAPPSAGNAVPEAPPRFPFSRRSFDVADVGDILRRASKVLVLCGAGISACRLPDFRSKDGIYAQIEKYKIESLQTPEDFFTTKFLRAHPELWYRIARELRLMLPAGTELEPTPCHEFISLLHRKNKLAGLITQNIDCLQTGVPPHLLLEAHGSLARAYCMNDESRHAVDVNFVRQCVSKNEVPLCPKCQALVRPDVVFFGESLPKDFLDRKIKMLKEADVLLICGTSLKVAPVAHIPAEVPRSMNRILINNELNDGMRRDFCFPSTGHTAEEKAKIRDCALLGDCQVTAQMLMKELAKPTSTLRTPPRSPARACAAKAAAAGSKAVGVAARRSPSSASGSSPSQQQQQQQRRRSPSSTATPPQQRSPSRTKAPAAASAASSPSPAKQPPAAARRNPSRSPARLKF